jgi:hypothetical protein
MENPAVVFEHQAGLERNGKREERRVAEVALAPQTDFVDPGEIEIPSDLPAFETVPPIRRRSGDLGGWVARSNLLCPPVSSGTPGGLYEAVLEILERGEPVGRRFRGRDWELTRDDDDLYGPARLRDYIVLRLMVLAIAIDRRRNGAMSEGDLFAELSEILAVATVGVEMLHDAHGKAIKRESLFAVAWAAANKIDEAARLVAHDLTLPPDDGSDK